MTEPTFIRRALISVSNKTGLVPFAQQLAASGIEILLLAEQLALLKQHGIPLTTVPRLHWVSRNYGRQSKNSAS